jgi:protein translocase SecG subunit
MTFFFLAASWSGAIWTILSVIAFIAAILLVGVVLIQDSKDSGLGGAFGGAGGGSALLGARMQKDLAKATVLFAVVLAVCTVILGIMDNTSSRRSLAETDTAVTATEVEGGGEATTDAGGADSGSAAPATGSEAGGDAPAPRLETEGAETEGAGAAGASE